MYSTRMFWRNMFRN